MNCVFTLRAQDVFTLRAQVKNKRAVDKGLRSLTACAAAYLVSAPGAIVMHSDVSLHLSHTVRSSSLPITSKPGDDQDAMQVSGSRSSTRYKTIFDMAHHLA